MPRFRKRALQSGLLLFGIASASVGVGLVFFAMMGSVFAFTQYLQFAHGFSALEAARESVGTAGHAFTEALGIGLAAAVALAGAPLVLLRLPSGRAPATASTAARPHPTPTAQPVTP